MTLTELATDLAFPEGPAILPDGTLACVEMAAGRVSRIRRDGGRMTLAETGGGPNGMAVEPDGHLYVCNNGGLRWMRDEAGLRPHGTAPDYSGGRIERINLETGRVERLYERCDGQPLLAPNDLVFGAEGGFYFTDTGRNILTAREYGRVLYATTDGSSIREVAGPMLTPNGVGLSPDGCTLYVVETETARLWSFSLTDRGEVAKAPYPSPHGGRCLTGLPVFCRFDSLALDAAGNICVATLVTGQVTVISPTGQVLEEHTVPDLFCTNLCFGGKDGRTAYVTLSSSGRLVAIPWTRSGLVLHPHGVGRLREPDSNCPE
ncbi:MAG: SMP-30/gluconolactonase/LRE family protein [Janthinobacterium lividum]